MIKLNDVERELVERFVANANEIKKLNDAQVSIRAKLVEQAPHKVGDVVKWTETDRKQNVGSFWFPEYKDLPDRERKAVVTRVHPDIYVSQSGELLGFRYNYDFALIKKDGTIGVNSVYVPEGCEWTGEHI